MSDRLKEDEWTTLQWSLGIYPFPFGKIEIKLFDEPPRKGGYGEVRLAEWFKDNEPQKVAVKRNYESAVDIMGEVLMLEIAQGWDNHIIQLLGVRRDPTTETTWMIMEFAEYGNLYDYLSTHADSITVEDKLKLAKGIVSGLNTLHKCAILHGDFHSGNILIDKDKKPKISDFGLSRGLNWSPSNITAGVIKYTAPEVLKGEPYTWAADVYSLGMIMWEISTNPYRRPFQGRLQDSAALRNDIINGLRENPEDSVLTLMPTYRYYTNLYQHCWISEPHLRPSTHDLLICLQKKTSFGPLLPVTFEINTSGGHADTDIPQSCTKTHFATPSILTSSISNVHNLEEIELHIEHIAVVNTKANNEQIALFQAAKQGCMKEVQDLEGHGAKIDIKDNDGKTALHWAARGGQFEVVLYLVELVDVDAKDNNGETALHLAAKRGHIRVVEILVKRACVNAVDRYGWTALHYAASNGHIDVVKFLVTNKMVNANAKNKCGDTALHEAALKGHIEVVQYLVLEGKLDVNAKTAWFEEKTALHFAAFKGHIKVVKFLVRNGAEVNAETVKFEKKTALQIAIEKGYDEIVKFLSKQRVQVV